MRVAAIGRTEIIYETIELLIKNGHEVPLIITAKEAPEYTKTAQDLKELAVKIGADFIQTAKILTTVEKIKSLPKMDIAVSINYSGIIPQEVIDLFPLGILNSHGGDLPRYRGNACQAWAILNGEDKIGLCVHSMIGGELDNGDIIARDYYDIDLNTKVTEIWNWMAKRTPELFLEAVEKLKKDKNYVLEIQSKDPKDALRCYPRIPEDGRIDWNKSNIEILRLINASNRPYAGAFCEFKGEKLIIWDAEIVSDNENYLAIAGQVTYIGENYIEVVTGKGKLRIKEVEYEGSIIAPNSLIKSIRKRLR